MPKYQYRDGTPYEGPVFEMPDGRVLSGSSYTRNSKRLVEIEDASERGGELHKTSPKKKTVQQSKARGKGRKSGTVVSKKSAKTSSAL